jgi:hypothetical protein
MSMIKKPFESIYHTIVRDVGKDIDFITEEIRPVKVRFIVELEFLEKKK